MKTNNNTNTSAAQAANSRNELAVNVPEAAYRFIVSTTGSDAIAPIPESHFANEIVNFIETKAAKAKTKPACSPGSNNQPTIKVILPNTHYPKTANPLALQGFLSKRIWEKFKDIFASYVRAYLNGGGQVATDAICDFCQVYQIEMSDSIKKSLSNAWHKSNEKKSLRSNFRNANFHASCTSEP
jgi:hypothetical protein